MVPTRLSSLSDKLAALLTNTEEEESQGREQSRPESEMEDDEETQISVSAGQVVLYKTLSSSQLSLPSATTALILQLQASPGS